MTVRHRFECVHCGHRIRATGENSAAARQNARERGATHINESHAERLVLDPSWSDRLAPDDLLTGDAAFGSLRGWLGPADDLLVCDDCGYYFGHECDDGRAPVGEQGLVCENCYDRRVRDHDDSVVEAIDDFFR
jgi:transcription elongation factor Elf1